MTVDHTTSAPQTTALDLIDRLGRFDGPPDDFIVNMLAVQCRLAPAAAGAIVRPSREEGMEVVAIYPQLPEGQAAPVWLAQAAEAAPSVIQGGQTAVRPLHESDDLYGQGAKRHVAMIPLRGGQGIRGVAAFLMETGERQTLARGAERLELTVSLLSLYEMRLTLQHRQMDLQRLRAAMETLATVNEQSKFKAAAMAFCNEVQSRWKCDRVSVGFLKGRYVKLQAMSDVEKFDRKTEPIQKLESTMEECLDQDVEVLYPSGETATYVARAAKELSQRFGPSTVLSLPLRHEGEVVGVVTVEREPDQPFEATDIEALRLACDLCTARLAGLRETDRWVGAKTLGGARKAASVAVGAKHTWIKLGILAVVGFAAFVTFAKGDFSAESTFVLEADNRREIAPKFDGVIASASVVPGAQVEPNQVLATMATAPLVTEIAKLTAERDAARTRAAAAENDGQILRAQTHREDVRKYEKQIEHLQWQLSQAKIVSPVRGVVLRSQLENKERPPVEKSKAIFEVAPLDELYAELMVPEDMLGELLARQKNKGQLTGELATKTYPDRRIPFEVARISPVAEVEKGEENVFKVRVKLQEKPEWLRPGYEGNARIHLGKKPYGYIWTRGLVNWVRMRLWI